MGFRETFTKDDPDGLLGYDDTAFYYFACSIIATVAIPWTYNVIKSFLFAGDDSKKHLPTQSKTPGHVRKCKTALMMNKSSSVKEKPFGGNFKCWAIQAGVLASIWIGLLVVVRSLSHQKEIKSFDPFEILEVPAAANVAEVKKAYRKLSLIYHPDKNVDDPLAASRFIEITKAYNALTDETAKTNYEKWGNPDGPQTTKVGIGLPRFLLEKNNQLMILCIFFFFLLFVVPMTFILYYQRTKKYAANGVMVETLQTLSYYINEAARVKNCSELLACSAESRGIPYRPSDNKNMKPLAEKVVEHKKRQFENWPIIIKNNFLILGHMQRLHHLMTAELREDLDTLLRSSMKVTQAMIEIACMREWFFTAQAMIEFRRSLLQALDIRASALLQIPHVTEENLKHFKAGKTTPSNLQDFLSREPGQRVGATMFEPEQLLDVEAFACHVSKLEVRAQVAVDGENDIVVGDVATVTVELKRTTLGDNETLGPVHAPFFPEEKYEELWVFLVEGTNRILAYERIRSTGRFMQEQLRLQLSRPGKHKFDLHILCDSYAGLDQKLELSFNVLREDDVKREIFVHKEDEDLDLQPTLFQQLMGDFGPEEESEEEEDIKTKRAPISKVARGGGNEAARAASGDDRSEEDADDGNSSASSSDSD